jgi:hypothetical protein
LGSVYSPPVGSDQLAFVAQVQALPAEKTAAMEQCRNTSVLA